MRRIPLIIICSVIALAIIVVAAWYFLWDRNGLSGILNARWTPISVEDQQVAAFRGAATLLASVPQPNAAAGLKTELIGKLALERIKEFGITDAKVSGAEQLLEISLSFARDFDGEDAGNDEAAKSLLSSAKPHIVGTLTLYVGLVADPITEATTVVNFKLLPALGTAAINRVELGGNNAEGLADAMEAAINRYSENITAALAELDVLTFQADLTPPAQQDISGLVRVSSTDVPDLLVVASGAPVTPPRLAGVAWLIDQNKVTVLAQYGSSPVTPGPEPKSFEELQKRFTDVLAASFDIKTDPGRVWVGLETASLASTLEDALNTVGACFSITGTIPKQSFESKVELPDENAIDCTPTLECNQTMECAQPHDERNCKTFFGNDPICELAKAAQNKIYDANRLQCEADKSIARGQCEVKKSSEKALCETAKEGVRRIARTGNVANLSGSIEGPAALNACISNVAIDPSLKSIRLNLTIDGGTQLATHIKFVPLDMAGFFLCQTQWTEDRMLTATIPSQTFPFDVGLQLSSDADRTALSGNTNEQKLVFTTDPPLQRLILESTNFNLSCAALAGLLRPLDFTLAPFIPELQGKFEQALKQMDFEFPINLPAQSIGGVKLTFKLQPTSLALVAVAN